MKKLTAGIFASILGLTAMGAADAAVTSKAYVDGLVGGINTSLGTKADQSALDQEVAAREAADTAIETAYQAADSSLQSQIDDKVEATQETTNGVVTTDATGKVQVSTAISQDQVVGLKDALSALPTDTTVAGKVDKDQGSSNANKVVVTGADGFVTTVSQIGQDKVTGLTDALNDKANAADVYTKTEVDASQKTQTDAITALQTKDTELAGQIATKADAQTVTDLATTVSGKANAADVYTKTEVDASQKTQTDAITALQTKDTELAGQIATKADSSALDGYVPTATYNAGQETQDTAIEALETSQATQNTAIEALQGFESGITGAAVTDNGSYVLTKIVSTNAEGQQVATYGWELVARDEVTQK